MPSEESTMADERHGEPLLHAVRQGSRTTAGGGSFSWLTALGCLLFLSFNSTMAIFRRGRDRESVAFVVFSYSYLLLLFFCLRWFERAEPGSATRHRLKVGVWLLTTLLTATAVFSYKVPAIFTVLGGFYAFFLHKDNQLKVARLLAAFAGGSVAGHGRRLIADTGASMHAVGDGSLLQDLRLFPIPERVKLPNGAVLRILGIGRIEWEHFSIPNVSLVEGFQKSLISISQLDRDHGMNSCFGKGIGEITLADGVTRVGGAILDENDGMYVLRFLEVP